MIIFYVVNVYLFIPRCKRWIGRRDKEGKIRKTSLPEDILNGKEV